MKKLMIEFMGKKTIKLNDVTSNSIILVEDSVPFHAKKILHVSTNDKLQALKTAITYLNTLAKKNEFELVTYNVTEMPLFIKNPKTDIDNYLNEIWTDEKYKGNFELIIDALYKKYEKEAYACSITPSGITFEEFASRVVNELCDERDREMIYIFVAHN